MKGTIVLLALLSVSLCSVLHRIGKNKELEVAVQWVKGIPKQKPQYFALDLSDVRHEDFKNNMATIQVMEKFEKGSCNMTYNLGLSSFVDDHHYSSYFTASKVSNVSKPRNIQTLQVNITKFNITQKPYVIGRIELYNSTKNATTCESAFVLKSSLAIQPIKVATNSTTNLTIYTNQDSADLRTISVDFTTLNSSSNYVHNTSIQLHTVNNNTVKQNLTVDFVFLYRNGTSLDAREVAKKGSKGVNIALPRSFMTGLEKAVIQTTSVKNSTVKISPQQMVLEVKTDSKYNPPGPGPKPDPKPDPKPNPKPIDSSGLSSTAIALIVIAGIIGLAIIITIIAKCVNGKKDEPLLEQNEASLQNRA